MTASTLLPMTPLGPLRVLDLSTGGASVASRLLAELGADVVRIEPLGGSPDRQEGRKVDGVSIDFVAANRGKRAGILDLPRAEAVARLDELLAETDIYIENFEPGSPEFSQFGGMAMSKRHPELVAMSITPFGHDSPLANWQATDPVLHALTAELSRSGMVGDTPLLPPGQIATECIATQAAYTLLIGYIAKLENGAGDWLDFAMLEGAVQTLDPAFGSSGSAGAGGRQSDLPRGRPDVGFQYPIIACADGMVRICVLAPRQWRGMFEWMGSPEKFADPKYNNIMMRFQSSTLIPTIARFFSDKNRFDLEADGQRHGVPIAAVLEPDEAISTAQTEARGALANLALSADLSSPWPVSPIAIDGQRTSLAAPTGIAHMTEYPHFLSERALQPPVLSTHTAGERPLDGLRVLDLGVIVVGAEAGRLLADAGADVVKIESPTFPDGLRQTRNGALMSASFAAGHRNKQSLAIDLRSVEGKSLFLKLIATSDILLSNFKPGTLDSLGFDAATLRQANPRLIMIDSSAFGPTGPWRQRLGYGPLVRAATGVTSAWSYAGRPGSYSDAFTIYPDHVCGRMVALTALALLLRRGRTGEGGRASISQAEVALSHSAADIAVRRFAREGRTIVQGEHDAPWGVFPCSGDDDWCVVTVRGDDDWAALAPVIGLDGDPTLADREGRIAARARIDAALVQWLAGQSPDSAMRLLQAKGIAAGAMLRVPELIDFAHFADRDFFHETSHPHLEGPLIMEKRLVRSLKLADPLDNPAPLLGEHSVAVLKRWLDLPKMQIASLAEQGTISIYEMPEQSEAN